MSGPEKIASTDDGRVTNNVMRHEYKVLNADGRVTNNVMRHEYKVLNADEKKAMQAIKDHGLALVELLDALGSSRELSMAKTKVEEAVMWGVKHVTR